jgi:hypothetical protein
MGMTRGILAVWALLLAGGPAGEARFDHSALARLLAAHVHDGRVDYRGLAKSRGDLDAYLAALAQAEPSRLAPKEQLAFWINAYNACVLDGVLEHFPIRTVTEVPQFFKRARCQVARKRRSLDEIEKDIIRPTFQEARAHFVLVCAARGCPALRSAPLSGAKLDADLDAAARAYLASPAGCRIEGDVVKLSQIFNWYADDFVKAAGSVPAFVGRYRKLPPGAHLAYLEYDWALNGR